MPNTVFALDQDIVLRITDETLNQSIDTTFHRGDISLDSMIAILSANLGANFVVNELHAPQSTAKLQIRQADNNDLSFAILDDQLAPLDGFDSFFGNLYNYDPTEIRSQFCVNLN